MPEAGRFRPRVWLSGRLAGLLFAPVEPLQRALGLPAFISRETVWACATNLNFSSDKAKRELGWKHRSAQAMWNDTVEGEIRLLARRRGQNLIQRLRPLDVVDALISPNDNHTAVRT